MLFSIHATSMRPILAGISCQHEPISGDKVNLSKSQDHIISIQFYSFQRYFVLNNSRLLTSPTRILHGNFCGSACTVYRPQLSAFSQAKGGRRIREDPMRRLSSRLMLSMQTLHKYLQSPKYSVQHIEDSDILTLLANSRDQQCGERMASSPM